jgi:hypothetical protein
LFGHDDESMSLHEHVSLVYNTNNNIYINELSF